MNKLQTLLGIARAESQLNDDSMLELVQREMRVWQEHNFPTREPWVPLLGVGEELGELNHAFIKRAQGIRGSAGEHTEALKDAVGDLLIFLADFCNSQDIDMHQVLWDTWNSVRERDWILYPKTGKPSDL